ncbi:FACT complex subunit spt16, partial [Phlyctochytrium bullatum]
MYKSHDFVRFAEIHRDVSEFKKEIQKRFVQLITLLTKYYREAERKEMADLVEQARLIEVKGRRPVLLREVFARPAIDSGKRLPGDLEIHTNGLRYQSGLRNDSKIGRKRRYNQGDEDEYAAEQEERRRRAQLNQDFKQFAERIREASKKLVDVDMPLRDLGFQGVPFKQPVLLLPTVNCMVHLIEPPFLVVTIAEIEIVHLERVR